MVVFSFLRSVARFAYRVISFESDYFVLKRTDGSDGVIKFLDCDVNIEGKKICYKKGFAYADEL